MFTLISDDETYGMVYIEAMLQGCLTIASRKGGFDGIMKTERMDLSVILGMKMN